MDNGVPKKVLKRLIVRYWYGMHSFLEDRNSMRPSEHVFTQEEAKKGGRASAESRRRRKAMREAFDELLSREFTDKEGNTTDGVTALVTRVYQKALKGDMRAVQFIRDTVGEMPVQKIEVDTIDPQARAEMDELLGLNEQ